MGNEVSCRRDGGSICHCTERRFRELFSEHAALDQFAILGAFNPSLTAAEKKALDETLIDNQNQIGMAFGECVGQPLVGEKMAALWREHIGAASNYIQVIQGWDEINREFSLSLADGASRKMYTNGAQISALISSLNPHSLPEAEVGARFSQHIQMIQELTLMVRNHDPSQYRAYLIFHHQLMLFADYLAAGLPRSGGKKCG